MNSPFLSSSLGAFLTAIIALGPANNAFATSETKDGPRCTEANELSAELGSIKLSIKDKIFSEDVHALISVHNKLAERAGFRPLLIVCMTGVINAFTHPNGEIAFHSGLFQVTGSDKDMLAAVIGHEFGHIKYKHIAELQEKMPEIIARGNAKFKNIAYHTGDFDLALKKENTQIFAEQQAFKREQELEADDFGTTLISKAGFNPDGMSKLMSRFTDIEDGHVTEWWEDHPAAMERLAKITPRVTDEKFEQLSTALIQDKEWRKLASTINQWLTLLPDSGNGWFNKAEFLQRLRRIDSVEAFERAFSADKPTLSKDKSVLNRGWLALCTGLYREGYKLESANCSQQIPIGPLRDQFVRTTFGGVMAVGEGKNPEHFYPSTLSIVKDSSGHKIITNDNDVLASRGMPPSPVPPPWRAIRYKPKASNRPLPEH